MDNAWLDRYLDLLGIKGREPTFATLTELAMAHEQVVFTNAASLIRKAATSEGPVPPLQHDSFLDAWHTEGPAGVCFETTSMAAELLAGMGFDSHVILGAIDGPRAHQANVVTVDGRRFLLDLGNGGPFFVPIPIDEGPVEIDYASLGFRFARQDDGQLVQYRRIDDAWQPFAWYEDDAADDDQRAEAFQHHHRLPAMSFVMGNFVLVQMGDGELKALRDHTFSHYKRSGKVSREVQGIDAYRGVIRDEFGLPNYPVDAALEAWSKVTGGTI
jgi:N-hydroxyarylamine O-acetyltransferase